MTRTITTITATAALLFAVPATASASPFLGYYKGRNAARQQVQYDNTSNSRSAWLNGCWRTARNRITCDYKTYELWSDGGGSTTCTGRVHAIRDEWGVSVTEQTSYYDCTYRDYSDG